MTRSFRRALALALVASVILAAGCPGRISLGRHPKATSLPAIRWSIQLEGDPWPWGTAGDDLLVWTYRFAQDGFLFPIKIESYVAANGKANWSVPIRPWLWSTESPWSYNATRTDGMISAWVKGDVARSLRLKDGTEAWSIPQCGGLVTVGRLLVASSGRSLLILDAATGRTLRSITLQTPLVAPPIVAQGKLVGLEEGRFLVGIDPQTGKVSWRVPVGGRSGQPDRPIPAGSYVLLGHLPTESSAAATAREEAVLEARRASTGALVWRKAFRKQAPGGHASPLGSLTVAGDLIFLIQQGRQCLVALELASGRQRFRRCELHLSTPPIRHGSRIFVLGDDAHSQAALKRGDPWHAASFPLLTLDAKSGRPSRMTMASRRHKRRRQAIRAVRLQTLPIQGDVLYLLQRHRFLTALRIRAAKNNSGE